MTSAPRGGRHTTFGALVQILDHGVWEGAPYIAMELLEGEDLARRLRHRRPHAFAPGYSPRPTRFAALMQ